MYNLIDLTDKRFIVPGASSGIHHVKPFGRKSNIDRQKTGTITREYAVA